MAEAPPGATLAETPAPPAPPPGAAAAAQTEEPIPSLFPPEGRTFAGAALEGVPIFGPTLIKLAEEFRAFAKGRPIEEVQAETQAIFEANPELRTAGNITGAIVGTAPLGVGGAGRLLFSTATRAIRTGAGLGAADAAARGGDLEDVALGAGLGAAGGAAGAGLARVGRGIVSAIRVPRSQIAGVIKEASDELLNQARALYRQADAVGVKLKAPVLNRIIDRITVAAKQTGDLADELVDVNAPKAASTLRVLEKFRGKEATLSEVDQIRQFVGDIAKSADASESRLGVLMRDALDDALDDLKNANFVQAEIKQGIAVLEAARPLWRRGRLVEALAEDVAAKAEVANRPLGAAIQSRVGALLNNRRFARGLSKAERAMLTKVARSDVDTILAMTGQLRTMLGASALGGSGAALTFGLTGGVQDASLVGGGLGLATQAVSVGARGLKSVLARQRLLDATSALRVGAGLPRPPSVAGGAAATTGATIGAGRGLVTEEDAPGFLLEPLF